MKTIYSCLLVLFFVSQLKAQLTLTKAANEPVVGDVRSLVSHDSTTTIPKNTGANQNWNFTSLTHTNSFTEVTTYTTTSSTPSAGLFPGATLAGMRGGNNYEYYKSSGSNLEYMGFYKTNNTEQLVLSNTAVFYAWPISFGSTNTDVASGVQTTGSTTAAISATLGYLGSGTGTVTLPNGHVENNCLQVISTLYLAIGSGSAAMTQTQITYGYYSPLRKEALIEIQYNTVVTGAGTTKEFSANVDDIGTVGLGEVKSESQRLTIYPMPASDQLNIRFENGKTPESVEVFDLNGKLLLSAHDTNFLDVSTLPESCYLMKITGNNTIYRRTLPIIKY